MGRMVGVEAPGQMTNKNSTPLAAEMEAYKRLLPSLLDRQGQFAVITGDRLIGTYSTWEDACKVGYQTVGIDQPFLVKKIEEFETTNFFTRDMGFPCRI